MPALNATTGMPAAMAFFTAGSSAGGSGRVTAMPSTLLSMALWIRLAWLPDDGSDEYLNSTLSLAAAAVAPLRMMSQKVSPGAPCVTIATVILGVFALPAAAPPPAFCSALLPPDWLQPVATARTAAARAARAARLGNLDMGRLHERCESLSHVDSAKRRRWRGRLDELRGSSWRAPALSVTSTLRIRDRRSTGRSRQKPLSHQRTGRPGTLYGVMIWMFDGHATIGPGRARWACMMIWQARRMSWSRSCPMNTVQGRWSASNAATVATLPPPME